MRTQLLIPSGEVLLGDAIEIAKRRRQTVAVVLFGHAAQGPQRILQNFGERHKTLTAEYHVGMLEARECQTEVIEPMISPAIVTPSAPMAVKSDSPIRPGGCS
jgi:hypothetical protein